MQSEGQVNTDNLDTILAMPIDLLFDFVGVHLDGDQAAAIDVRINVTFTDIGGDWTMWVRNTVMNARPGHVDGVQLTVAGPKAALAALLLQPAQAEGIIAKAGLTTDGDASVFATLAAVMDTFDASFNLSTP